jgi:hypothetical protein
MATVDNKMGKGIGEAAKVVAVSLVIVLLVLSYYLWSYGPVDYIERALAGEERLDLGYVWQQTLIRFAAVIDGQRGVFTDFIWHYRPAGIMIYATGLPGYKFFYSAFFALSLAPLGRIPLADALGVWAWIQLAGIVLLVMVPGLHFLRRSRRAYYMYVVLTLLSLPVLHNLMWGQVSVPIIVCMLGALCFYIRGGKAGAAALLALATSIKLYPAVLAIYFVARREFRLLAMFVAWTMVLLVAVPAVRLGSEGLARFQRASDEGMGRVASNARIDSNSQYLPHVAMRYLKVTDPLNTDPRGWRIVAYGLFAANVLLLCGALRARLEDPAETGFSLLLLSTPLIVQTSWPHYFVYLPFCQVFAWQVIGRRRTDARAVLQYGLVGVSVVLSSSVLFNWFGDFSGYSWYGCLFWSNMLVVAVLYMELAPRMVGALRGTRTGRRETAGTGTYGSTA